MPPVYALKEGSELWDGVKLGPLLGQGVQAKVFELLHGDGSPTGKVLKISHTGGRRLGHAAVCIHSCTHPYTAVLLPCRSHCLMAECE